MRYTRCSMLRVTAKIMNPTKQEIMASAEEVKDVLDTDLFHVQLLYSRSNHKVCGVHA